MIELAFRAMGRNWASINVPIEVIYINGLDEESTANFIKVKKLLQETEDYQKKAEEERRNRIMQEFIDGSLTFINPIETILKEVKKTKVDNYQKEPSIIDFSRMSEDDDLDFEDEEDND